MGRSNVPRTATESRSCAGVGPCRMPFYQKVYLSRLGINSVEWCVSPWPLRCLSCSEFEFQGEVGTFIKSTKIKMEELLFPLAIHWTEKPYMVRRQRLPRYSPSQDENGRYPHLRTMSGGNRSQVPAAKCVTSKFTKHEASFCFLS